MTDKEKIRAEIERLENELNYVPFTDEVLGKRDALNSILSFIDSLPEESVSQDLEEEIIKIRKHHFINNDWDKQEFDGINISNMLRHIAKWQKNQMMKNAVNAGIYKDKEDCTLHAITVPIDNVEFGERVKAIIIKDQ